MNTIGLYALVLMHRRAGETELLCMAGLMVAGRYRPKLGRPKSKATDQSDFIG